MHIINRTEQFRLCETGLYGRCPAKKFFLELQQMKSFAKEHLKYTVND